LTIDFEPLRKILELEQKKNYSDSVVFGGLDRFLRNWSSKVVESITSPKLLKKFKELRIINSDYASLTQEQRADWVKDVLDFIPVADGLVKKKAGHTTVPKNPDSPVIKRKRIPADIKPQPSSGQTIESSIISVPGISTALSKKFDKLGVKTIRNLLYFFPHRHLDYSQIKQIAQLTEGEEQTIVANVWQAQITMLGGRRSTEAIVGDETGNVRIVWFNQPFMARNLATNMRVVISGRVSLFQGRYVFESPEWESAEESDTVHTGRLVPVYHLTQGLKPRQVRRLMKPVVDRWALRLVDFLPSELRDRCNLLGLPEAIIQAHYPEDEVMKDRARTRLAFDELFLLQLGVLSRKRAWQAGQPGNSFDIDRSLLDTFINSLSFKLTEAQQKVLKEILADLQKPQAMSRLLQGDVGSGKTVVATTALLAAVSSGFQGVFMAPTEILAEQHFNSICKLMSEIGDEKGDGYVRSYSGIMSRPLTVALLIGDVKQAIKREFQKLITAGEIDIIIGTHALIQKGVSFAKLGLAVIDEQHRFGVSQRLTLRQKGFNPHVLAMTATPIPRTLALTLYGDLDLSVIDELPPGRQTIKTKWLGPEKRASADDFIRKQVSAGHQAFIICPLIEESDVIQAKAAVAEFERLSSEVFPNLRMGLLHGRMSAAVKDSVMRDFREGTTDILVSTPVVEVGIDVPNATVMMVESADRFGLSQLHQFRGRVGRGPEQSYCILLAENPSFIGKQRLDIIEKVYDGFALAEEDLKLRGPGEFFGTRQSGMPDLRMARLSDVALLELVRNEAEKLFQKDTTLSQPEHQPMFKEMERVWQNQTAEWS